MLRERRSQLLPLIRGPWRAVGRCTDRRERGVGCALPPGEGDLRADELAVTQYLWFVICIVRGWNESWRGSGG